MQRYADEKGTRSDNEQNLESAVQLCARWRCANHSFAFRKIKKYMNEGRNLYCSTVDLEKMF